MDDGERPLTLSSYSEMLEQEQELIRRLSNHPNGARLFLLDPLRCLREVGGDLADEAISGWRERAGEELKPGPASREAYEAIAASDPSASDVTVEIQGLFRKDSAR